MSARQPTRIAIVGAGSVGSTAAYALRDAEREALRESARIVRSAQDEVSGSGRGG